MSDRAGRLLEIDWGDPVSTEAQKHRFGLCSMIKKEQILAGCQAEINRHEFQAACDRRSLRKLGELLNLNKKNFTALELKKFNDEINSFFKDSYCSKSWNYVKLIREVSLKWKS